MIYTMTERLTFTIRKEMKSDLEEVTEETGLSMSEIGRRGLLEQIRELKGDYNSEQS